MSVVLEWTLQLCVVMNTRILQLNFDFVVGGVGWWLVVVVGCVRLEAVVHEKRRRKGEREMGRVLCACVCVVVFVFVCTYDKYFPF